MPPEVIVVASVTSVLAARGPLDIFVVVHILRESPPHSSLSLPLLVLRIPIANDVDSILPSNRFASFTQPLDA